MAVILCMYVDGTALAANIRGEVADRIQASGRAFALSIVAVAPTSATRSYLTIKQRTATAVGVSLHEETLPADTSEDAIIAAVHAAAEGSDGVVVQLPLPEHVDTQRVLDAIPQTHDVDVLSTGAREQFAAGTYSVVPPVVAAMATVLERHGISVAGQRVAVIGSGYLVGAPAATWCSRHGASVTVIDRDVQQHAATVAAADIVITGVGQPGVITPDMVQPGAVVLDAGASVTDAGGAPVGDVDPACAERASLLTPVPGGIGPIAVACLFRNLVTVANEQ